MLSTVTVAEDPLSLHSATRRSSRMPSRRSAHILALAQPGRSCLLESVEGTDRISRYSFIGLDYLEAARFDDDPRDARRDPRDGRQATGVDTSGAAVSGRRGLRVHLRCRPRSSSGSARSPRSDIPFSDALVVVPGTWVVFDHFTHRVTLIGFARDARGIAAVDERLGRVRTAAAYRAGQRPGGRSRAAAPVTQSMDRATYLERGRARRSIASSRATSTRCRSASASRRPSRAARRSISTGRSAPAIPRRTCSTSSTAARRCSARRPSFWCGSTDARRACARWPERARAARIRRSDAAVAAELLANEKERAEHVMLVDLGRNDWVRSRRPAACTSTS